jgi:hypothetical protein
VTDCQFLYRTFRPDGRSDLAPAEIIALQCWYDRQFDAIRLDTTLRCKGFGRFRVSIDTGRSKGGSIELWTPNGWTPMHDMPVALLRVVRPYDRAVAAIDFKADVEELVRVACEILEG